MHKCFFKLKIMKTFNEKRQFYKERQEVYDLVKTCKDNKYRHINLCGIDYNICSKEFASHVLLYCKRTKRPEVFGWHDDHKLATTQTDSIRISSSKAESSVLLYLSLDDGSVIFAPLV